MSACTSCDPFSHKVAMAKADPFFGRSRARFRVPPWVSNTIARKPPGLAQEEAL